MRFGGALPGAAATAPAQYVCSVAAVERSVREMGAVLEQRGTEPSAHRRVRGRIEAREANAALVRLKQQEACLLREIMLINAARADPDVQVEGLMKADAPLRWGSGGSADDNRKCR